VSKLPLIQAQSVHVHRGGKHILEKVTFDVNSGEITTIVGPNGSGKSTLLKALIGNIELTEGSVQHKPGIRIGYLPQTVNIDSTLPLSVRRLLSLPKSVNDSEALLALSEAGVANLVNRQFTELSGGQRQRVLLARALLGKPHVVILDEPTQGLDQPGSAAFYRQIDAIRQSTGCAILMVSHELHVVMASSDHVICLNGHVCCAGRPEQVATAPEYRALFGSGTQGALALYRHEHTHTHHDHGHDS